MFKAIRKRLWPCRSTFCPAPSMTEQAVLPTCHCPRDTVVLLRLLLGWLLVALLTVDLVTTPLHAHHHRGEWSAGGPLGPSLAHANDMPGDVDVFSTVEHDQSAEFSHSISTLRRSVEVMTDAPEDKAAAAVPWFVPAFGSPGSAATFVWPPDRHRAGSSAFKSLPPNGRAPPLHA